MSLPFEAQVVKRPDETIVSLRGELDMVTVAYFSQLVDELLASRRSRLVLDLSGVTFIDSRGLAAILAAHRSWTDDGRTMEIVRGSRAVMRVFEMSGIVEMLPFINTDGETHS
jgi:anti-anti-sigma factor